MLRIAALGTLMVYWTVIFIGTHVPDGIRGLGDYDKLLHFGAYVGLAFLLAAALATVRLRCGTLLLPLAVAAVYGCLDELSQSLVHGRHPDVIDWIADVLGAGVGVFVFGVLSLAVTKVLRQRPAPPCETVTESAA